MANSNEVVIERVFDGPCEKVWKAWTDPEQIKKWWGPKDFTAPIIKVDFRVGGTYLYCMRGQGGPDGPVQDFWTTGTYKEIVPLEKIVATDSFADAEGNIVSATHYGMPADLPLEFQMIITFEDLGDKTKMVLTHIGMPEDGIADDMETGWNQSFDKMEAVFTKPS
jgi:uncharacterized protein YndB with AHSA1/START domain